MAKPRLIPVEVPWKIAVSTSFLQLVITEFDKRTTEFIAQFLSDNGDIIERRVTVTFERAGWFRGAPSISESNIVDESEYDWSEVNPRPKAAEEVKEWVKTFNSKWRESGNCPDPRMYEVQPSEWLASIETQRLKEYKHLLILSEEMYIEVLCKGWGWASSEEIDWSAG